MDEQELTELNSAAYQLISEPNHLIGKTLGGRFVIDEHLGTFEGREVYAGRQPALDRPVTIKLVHEASNQDLCRRFLREGRLLAKLDHPGIVSVIDVGEHDGRPYVVTEAPRGDTLETILEARGRIDWRAAQDLLIALADAVGSAHAAGLVHRDLHPRNIVVAADGQPRITDFVFAYETTAYTDQGSTQILTARGAMVGAVEWVAPEQLMGFPVDMRADLYSLGVLAYRMIAGHVPHRSTRAAEILSLQAQGATPLMSEATLPDEARPFAELIDRLLASEPEKRGFRDANELASALRKQRAMLSPAPVVKAAKRPAKGHPIRERTANMMRSAIAQARPLANRAIARARPLANQAIARARALPLKAQLGIVTGALVLSLGGLIAIASSDEPKVEALPIAQPTPPPIDPAQLAIRADAREAVRMNDIPRALHGYRTLAPEAFEAEDHQNVVQYLARPNSNTGVAEKILIATSPASIPALKEAFTSERSSRYLKRRAGEVLDKLGEPVDLVPLWIETLESKECNARRLAVRRLVESRDPRAVGPLQSLGKSMSCGGQEARDGLRHLRTSG